MSLCAWFPLIGTLDNQGVDNVSFTTTGTAWTTDGKLGKCLKLGYSSDFTIPSLVKSKQISIAYWLRVNTATSTQWLDPIHYYTNPEGGTGVGWVTRQELYSNCTLTGFWFDNGSIVSIPITVGQWAHFAITVDYEAGIAKVYKDGVLQGTSTSVTKTTQVTGNNFKIGESGLDLSENDVRIYNHILSTNEVEILSRGLVVHYPLTGGGRGEDNLLKYTAVNTANQTLLGNSINSAWKNLPLTTIDGFQCYNYPKSYSPTGFYSGTWYLGLKANTTYSYSAYLYFTEDIPFNFTSLGHFQVINDQSTASDKSHEDIASARIYEPSTIKANTWTKVRITFTTNNLAGSRFTVYPRYSVASNVGELYFRGQKLEESPIPTPWVPNTIDNEYTSMGYDSTTEYDVSGNGYDGTKVGTLTYDSDTPRYSACTVFNGLNTYIESDSLPAETKTISLWIKTTWDSASSYNIAVFDKGTKLAIGWSSNRIITYIGSSGGGTGSQASTTGYFIANQWNHVVVVKTGDTTRLIYINGESIPVSGTNYWSGDLSKLQIGCRHAAGAYQHYFNGQLSDFRAYATELTATQVKRLYNTPVSLSNNGTLLTQGEFVET